MEKSLGVKLLRFALVGVAGALVDFSTRALLLHLGFPGSVARGCSYIIGSTVAYYLNSYVTFGGERSRFEKLRAATAYLLCFSAAVAVDVLLRHLAPSLPGVLFWSWFGSQVVATMLNFLLQNWWVFRTREVNASADLHP